MTNNKELQQTIDKAWDDRASLQPGSAPARIGEAVGQVIAELDQGRMRVAEKIGGEWTTHQWLKKAVLLSFRLEDNRIMQGGELRYFDKVESKFASIEAVFESCRRRWLEKGRSSAKTSSSCPRM